MTLFRRRPHCKPWAPLRGSDVRRLRVQIEEMAAVAGGGIAGGGIAGDGIAGVGDSHNTTDSIIGTGVGTAIRATDGSSCTTIDTLLPPAQQKDGSVQQARFALVASGHMDPTGVTIGELGRNVVYARRIAVGGDGRAAATTTVMQPLFVVVDAYADAARLVPSGSMQLSLSSTAYVY